MKRKPPEQSSIREQRAHWLKMADGFLKYALDQRELREYEKAKRYAELARHIRSQASGGDPYEVIEVAFDKPIADWLRKTYRFDYERPDGPDLSRERKRLEKMIARGEA
jgi:hypothetical protein